ncbi:MAG: ATP-binding protein, partial [Thermoplasmata archaeon]
MALPSWWQVATPHKDIREGRLSESIFAADLGDVVRGEAPMEYQDPVIFFQKTYLTKGLRNLLENILDRLGNGKGDPVIQLQTPFGGGKTHALLSLYHAVKHTRKLDHLPMVAELPTVEKASVAVFVGTHADAVSGKTPWGEIAEQLGCYDIIEEHDEKRVAPGKERLREMIERSGPTLILIDEILEYIVKAVRAEKVEKITQGQTLAFLQEISEVIASSEDCCLVIALPTSILERYDEEAEKSFQQLQKIVGRVEAIYTPVEGVELYEIIRKRLFEDIGSEDTRRRTAEAYFDLYQKLGGDVPSEVRDVQYRERIERAYPFHPELVDVLYERWGSIPTFQRTRGALRLLAEVVADLYRRKVVSPLIHSSLINLKNQAIRREFIKHIGDQYDSVIAADIAGKNAQAPKIDTEMGSEYQKYNIATGIATSVFLYSFSGGEKMETTLPRIRVSLLREGIPSTIVGDAIAKLEEQLWYFHSERKQYAFRNQPNLNRIIVQREESVTEERIQQELRDLLQVKMGRFLEGYLWPKESSDIPDNKNLKLAVLAPLFSYGSDKEKELSAEFFERAGAGFRVYKNTLFL